MPNTKSAKKKMRQDKKRQALNLLYKKNYKKAVKRYLIKPSANLLKTVFSLIDKAAKKKVIHKNKAARLKSKLGKLITGKNG